MNVILPSPVSELMDCSTTALNFQVMVSQWLHHEVEPVSSLSPFVDNCGNCQGHVWQVPLKEG